MSYKLSDRTREIAANSEYQWEVVDAITKESEKYDGLNWVHTVDIANELCSIMLGDGEEVEEGSQINELMISVVLMSYDQALKRAAKVLNVPIKELQKLEYELSEKEGF